MDATEIFDRLGIDGGLPVEALRAAHINRAAMVPLFLKAFEQSATADGATQNALFFAFHLLGQWREKSAYRPLTTFLRGPSEQVGSILGDAITETSHRVLAAVFDGNPKPLYDVILDPNVDEFIRARMCDAIAILSMRQELPRDEVVRFFRACNSELQPQDDCFVWDGWQGAIARLGLAELKPLVEAAFERGFIDPGLLSFTDFEQDLQSVLDHGPAALRHVEDEYELFGDAVEELSGWDAFKQQPKEKRQPSRIAARDSSGWSMTPVTNPFRNVGRNDPCPCGSGRKFKKCCLGKAELTPEIAEPPNWHDLEAAAPSESGEFAEYDPLVEPAPVDWLDLSEQDRIDLIEDYHRRTGVRVPAMEAHAIIHLIVENQIAEGDALPVRRTAQRLMSEGLDRHDAIHAIGTVLAGHLNDLMREAPASEQDSSPDPNDAYFAELKSLTAEVWLRSA